MFSGTLLLEHEKECTTTHEKQCSTTNNGPTMLNRWPRCLRLNCSVDGPQTTSKSKTFPSLTTWPARIDTLSSFPTLRVVTKLNDFERLSAQLSSDSLIH